MKKISLEVFNRETILRYEEDGIEVDKLKGINEDIFLNIPNPEILSIAKKWISEIGLVPEEIKIAKKQMYLSWSDTPKKLSLKYHLDKIFSLEVDDVLTIDMDNITGIKTAYYKEVKGTDKKFTFNRVGRQWKITRLR